MSEKITSLGAWEFEKLPEDSNDTERIIITSNTTTITLFPHGKVIIESED